MLDGSGVPRDPQEVSSEFAAYFGTLFSSDVRDSDLPMDPRAWLKSGKHLEGHAVSDWSSQE
eukprot:389371-Alexandrium_andersonii.AAC.1